MESLVPRDMEHIDLKDNDSWLQYVDDGLRSIGYAVVTNVLGKTFREETRSAMYRMQRKIQEELGEQLKEARELGVLRMMFKYDSHFFRFLEIPEVLAVVDRTVSNTAVLHLQNGLILPPIPEEETPKLQQNQFHRDFPRLLNGYLASVNVFFAIDEFTKENGATRVIPGTHQRAQISSEEYIEKKAVPITCPAGSMIVFDSTLSHCASYNVSAKDRLAVNHQFTRSYFRQQLDYPRALGERVVEKLTPRTQQLLGWYVRVPSSLEEFYRPADQRLYRPGQG